MIKALVIAPPPLDVYGQMAADEALCEAIPAPYMLRFYNWKGPGITFGYSQRRRAVAESIAATGSAIGAITRRPTGGGIVFHETDLTFSFIFPYPGACFEPGKIYDRLHRAITAQYSLLDAGFELLNGKTGDYEVNDPVMNCFAKPVNLDILYNGKKALGGALRKFGGHMLYQASLQIPDARSNSALHKDTVVKALGGEFGLEWEMAEMPEDLRLKTGAIAEAKYRAPEWNERI